MKILKTLIITCIFYTACQKKPEASFTTDKTEYYAGDTIHLISTSQNAHSYIWTTPDGSIFTTQNTDYIVNANTLYDSLQFKIEVFSKNKKKSNSVSKYILATIKPKLIDNKFTTGVKALNAIYQPIKYSNNKTTVYATSLDGGPTKLSIAIYFRGNLSSLKSSVYTLQPDTNLINTTNSCIIFSTQDYDCNQIPCPINYNYSLSGKLVLKVEGDYLHLIFNEINMGNFNLTGNLKSK